MGETYRQAEKLLGKVPLFGICLGTDDGQAAGAEIDKLKFGHHGGNHPVQNLLTGRGRGDGPEPRLPAPASKAWAR